MTVYRKSWFPIPRRFHLFLFFCVYFINEATASESRILVNPVHHGILIKETHNDPLKAGLVDIAVEMRIAGRSDEEIRKKQEEFTQNFNSVEALIRDKKWPDSLKQKLLKDFGYALSDRIGSPLGVTVRRLTPILERIRDADDVAKAVDVMSELKWQRNNLSNFNSGSNLQLLEALKEKSPEQYEKAIRDIFDITGINLKLSDSVLCNQSGNEFCLAEDIEKLKGMISRTDGLNDEDRVFIEGVLSRFSSGLEEKMTDLGKVIEEGFAEIDAQLGNLEWWAEHNNTLLNYLVDSEGKRQQRELDRQISQLKRADNEALLGMLALAVGGQDPETAQRLLGVGHATLDLIDAIDSFSDSGFGQLGFASATFNLANASMAFFNSFGNGGLDANDLILGELEKIQTQLREFQNHVDVRFDRVDAGLYQILSNIIIGFDIVMGQSDRNLASIQENTAVLLDTQLLILESTHRLSEQIDAYQLGPCIDRAIEKFEFSDELNFRNCISTFGVYSADILQLNEYQYSEDLSFNTLSNYLNDPGGSKGNLLYQVFSLRNGETPGSSVRVLPQQWMASAEFYQDVLKVDAKRSSKLSVTRTSELLSIGERSKDFQKSVVEKFKSFNSDAEDGELSIVSLGRAMEADSIAIRDGYLQATLSTHYPKIESISSNFEDLVISSDGIRWQINFGNLYMGLPDEPATHRTPPTISQSTLDTILTFIPEGYKKLVSNGVGYFRLDLNFETHSCGLECYPPSWDNYRLLVSAQLENFGTNVTHYNHSIFQVIVNDFYNNDLASVTPDFTQLNVALGHHLTPYWNEANLNTEIVKRMGQSSISVEVTELDAELYWDYLRYAFSNHMVSLFSNHDQSDTAFENSRIVFENHYFRELVKLGFSEFIGESEQIYNMAQGLVGLPTGVSILEILQATPQAMWNWDEMLRRRTDAIEAYLKSEAFAHFIDAASLYQPIDSQLAQLSEVQSALDNFIYPSLLVDDVSLDEGFGSGAITLTMQDVDDERYQINYRAISNTALGGTDYELVSGSLFFDREAPSKSIPLIIHEDGLVEGDEEFVVQFESSDPEDGISGQFRITIADNDVDSPADVNTEQDPPSEDNSTEQGSSNDGNSSESSSGGGGGSQNIFVLLFLSALLVGRILATKTSRAIP